MKSDAKKALLIVDVQNDFCPGGALAVPGGDGIIGDLNRYIEIFSRKRLPIFFTRDWHPARTRHFKKFGGQWPAHCIIGTRGAEFHPGLELPREAVIFSKGMDPEKDSYSALDSFDNKNRRFIEVLERLGIKELYIGGLATDYCVRQSSLDALKLSLKVKLLLDAIKGVDLNPGDSERAIKEMVDRGAEKIVLGDL